MASKIKVYIKDGNTRINIPGINLNFLSFLVMFGFSIAKAFIKVAVKNDYTSNKSDVPKGDADKPKVISLDKKENDGNPTESETDYSIDDLNDILNKLDSEDIKRLIKVFKDHEPFTLVHVMDGDTEVLIRTL